MQMKKIQEEQTAQIDMKFSNMESELMKRDEELSELKLAYKEKLRKCQGNSNITITI